MNHTINPEFFQRSTVLVARELLGKRLVRKIGALRLSGIIVETEAYQADDPACHAYRGKTPRNQMLFGPVGHSYVYFIYGNHFCLNIVAREPSMISGGILIRALVPEEGIAEMRIARNIDDLQQLTNGPGKLTQALQISRSEEGINITQPGSLYIEHGVIIAPENILATPRIGITTAQDKLWRFVIKK